MYKKLLVVFMALLMINTNILFGATYEDDVNTSEIDSNTENFMISSAEATEGMEEIKSERLVELQGIFENQDVKINTDGNLNYGEVFGKSIDNQEILYIPIEIENVRADMNFSHLAVTFKDGEYDSYMELSIVGNDVNYTSEIIVYQNGALIGQEVAELTADHFNQNVNQSGELLGENVAQANGFTDWFSRFNDCLASQGIAGWIVTSISIACGFSCGSPVPACTACLVGAALVTEGVVVWCIGIASGG